MGGKADCNEVMSWQTKAEVSGLKSFGLCSHQQHCGSEWELTVCACVHMHPLCWMCLAHLHPWVDVACRCVLMWACLNLCSCAIKLMPVTVFAHHTWLCKPEHILFEQCSNSVFDSSLKVYCTVTSTSVSENKTKLSVTHYIERHGFIVEGSTAYYGWSLVIC